MSRPRRKRRAPLEAAGIVLLGLSSAGTSHALPLPRYEITVIGFLDGVHAGSPGYPYGGATLLNDAGYVAGFSGRVAGGGLSAWAYDSTSGALTQLGLVDAEHTRSDGRQDNQPTHLSEGNHTAGIALRFDGASEAGQSAWVHSASGTTTTRVGFFDAAHTRSDGHQSSRLTGISSAGRVAGFSERYDDPRYSGYSAWLFDANAGTTLPLGFLDAEHTRSDGYRWSFTNDSADSGHVAGQSARFDGDAFAGGSAWIYDANSATTTRVGLTDAAHVGANGLVSSSVAGLLESGSAVGHSELGGDGSLGRSAWVYDSASSVTTRIGYTDLDHTSADGYQLSEAHSFTETGYVAGHSTRYGPSFFEGRTAWIHDVADGSTTRIGLFDALHTDLDGTQWSEVGAVANSGDAIGTSSSFGVGGLSAWVYDSASSAIR